MLLLASYASQAQVSLGMSRTVINLPDTVSQGDTTTFKVWVKNYGPGAFTGTIFVHHYSDSVINLDTTMVPANSLAAGDSVEVDIFEEFDSPGYKKGSNIVVIWPSALNATTMDSLREAVYVLEVDIPGGLDRISASGLIKLFPNPVADRLYVEGNEVIVEEIKIINAAGQIVEAHSFPRSISFASLPPGYYFLSVRTKDTVVTLKVIKKE